MDSAVVINFSNRIISSFSSLIILFFVATELTPVAQGYYYTFMGLISLQMFFELGMGFVIVNVISHEMESLFWKNNNIEGESGSQKSIYAYINYFFSWYKRAAILLIICLSPIIFFYLKNNEIDYFLNTIAIPWLLLVSVSAINLVIQGQVCVLEGTGKIKDVSIARLKYALLMSITMVLSLNLGLELYSIPLGILAGMIGTLTHIIKFKSLFVKSIQKTSFSLDGNKIGEIKLLNNKVSSSWISGYFVFYSITPIMMFTTNAIEAGKIGMTLQILQSINSLASIPISTNAPKYGKMISQKRTQAMKVLFKQNLLFTLLIFVVVISLLWGTAFMLATYAEPYRERIVNNTSLLMLTVSALANQIFFAMNYYIRAKKKDLFWFISIVNSVYVVTSLFLVTPKYGAEGAAAVYLSATLIFWIILSVPMFIKDIIKDGY